MSPFALFRLPGLFHKKQETYRVKRVGQETVKANNIRFEHSRPVAL